MGATIKSYYYLLRLKLESDFQLTLNLSPSTYRDSLKAIENLLFFLIAIE